MMEQSTNPIIEGLFLGIRDGVYVGGRLQNYTNEIDVNRIIRVLTEFELLFAQNAGKEPFDMIEILEKQKEVW